MPKMLLQPLVENSVIHGISRAIEGGTVRVEASRDEAGHVQIHIWNNGMPIASDRQMWLRKLLQEKTKPMELNEQHASIGLLNVKTRIQLQYGDQYGIDFDSTEELGTRFTITLKPDFSQGESDS